MHATEALMFWTAARDFRLTGDDESRDDLVFTAMYTDDPTLRSRCEALLSSGTK